MLLLLLPPAPVSAGAMDLFDIAKIEPGQLPSALEQRLSGSRLRRREGAAEPKPREPPPRWEPKWSQSFEVGKPSQAAGGSKPTALPPKLVNTPVGVWRRDKSDCHFRKTATEYDRKPGIK